MDGLAFVRQQARFELARRHFYDYCQHKYPRHYSDDRTYLKEVCQNVQAFSQENQKRFLIINMPPHHYKSFTAGNFVEWRFGEDPTRKVMTGSYNETLSTTFARKRKGKGPGARRGPWLPWSGWSQQELLNLPGAEPLMKGVL